MASILNISLDGFIWLNMSIGSNLAVVKVSNNFVLFFLAGWGEFVSECANHVSSFVT